MPELKLFGKWDVKNIEIKSPALRQVITLRPEYIPHTHGRHEHKRFGKLKLSLVERFINRLMGQGINYGNKASMFTNKNCGKKLRAMKVMKRALEIIELKTGENPIQVLVRAVENAAVREETTRVMYGGILYFQAVDTSPSRSLDLAIRHIVQGAALKANRNPMTLEEAFAEEVIATANYDRARSHAIKRKEEIERIAMSSR